MLLPGEAGGHRPPEGGMSRLEGCTHCFRGIILDLWILWREVCYLQREVEMGRVLQNVFILKLLASL